MSATVTTIRPLPTPEQRGFSLIEVMISMVVMTVGLVSLLGVFGLAMAATQSSDQNAIAKQLANEALEGILTARETANVSWAAIQNQGNGGIFRSGPQPIRSSTTPSGLLKLISIASVPSAWVEQLRHGS